MYQSPLPRISPLISKVDVMIPPEGWTTSAVRPATLRTTGSVRTGGATVLDDGAGADAGTSAAGAAGFDSSGLRHMVFFPSTENSVTTELGWVPGSPERTVTRKLYYATKERANPANLECFQYDTGAGSKSALKNIFTLGGYPNSG